MDRIWDGLIKPPHQKIVKFFRREMSHSSSDGARYRY